MPPSAYPQPQGSPPPQANPYVDCNGMTTKSDTREAEAVDETPLEEALCKVARNVSFNIDYINWGIVKPQTQLIGAQPTLATLNPGLVREVPQEFIPFVTANELLKSPTQFFPVADGEARAYDTGPISLYENSGIKGTVSLPLTFGSAELTGFILQHAESQVNLGGSSQGSAFDTPPDQDVRGHSCEGQRTDVEPFGPVLPVLRRRIHLAGIRRRVQHRSQPDRPQAIWFTDPAVGRISLLGDSGRVRRGGGRIRGVATTTIQSRTNNNIYGPQIGCRFELVTQWFTIGADPRVMVGVNQLPPPPPPPPSDPTIGNSADRIAADRFTAVGALDLYTKIPIHDQVKLYLRL